MFYKKSFFALGAILIAALCLSCSSSQYKNMQVSLPDLKAKADGTYRGEQSISGTPVKVTLDAVLRNHEITSIKIVGHICSPIGKKAEKITEDIIKQQSLDVDVVSGATASSKAILRAVENALQ